MGELSYRIFEEPDLPGMLRLWEEAGWGSLSPQQWREWFVDGPHGPCLIAVAVDSRGEIAGQEVFAPSRVSVEGREVRALRFSAPVLRQEIRGESLRKNGHPVFGLYKAAASAAQESGYEMIYSLPDHAWLPVFRLAAQYSVAHFESTVFGCAGVPLEAAALSRIEPFARPVEARPVSAFGAEYEELWRSARESFPISCGVVRDSGWLTFRNSGRIAFEVRARFDGSLIGYSATKRQTGLLADVLARRPEDLTAVIAATASALAGLGGISHLKAMRTPALEPALEALGFEPVDYRFAFLCDAFGLPAGLVRIPPERWYVMPGD